jgi:phosphoesterase RecJ-like protein
MMTTPETAHWLMERDCFLILTHRRPDGDTAGSAGALAQGLRDYGKNAYILPNPEMTPRYMRFIKEYHPPPDFEADTIITVDIASYDLLTKNAEEYKDKITLCIDHHSSNTEYAEYLCLDSDTASCGELVYKILIGLSSEISPKIAECLYVAVATDTGCFAYANTTANTLQTAAYLVKAGAPQKELNKTFFRTKTRSRIDIEGKIYSGLEYYFNGRVAIASISKKMMEEAGATEDDIDDISSLPIVIEGVIAGITIRELKSEQDIKVSIRTMPGIDANAIAAQLGGGGHRMAAGVSVTSSIADVKEKLIEIIADCIDQDI